MTSEARTQAAIVEALRQVPPVHLAIYDLWHDLVDQDGQVDTLRASERAEEIMAAVGQAGAYAETTQMVLKQLTRLTGERP